MVDKSATSFEKSLMREIGRYRQKEPRKGFIGDIQKGRAPFGRLNEGSPEGTELSGGQLIFYPICPAEPGKWETFAEIRNLPPLACLCLLSARTESKAAGRQIRSYLFFVNKKASSRNSGSGNTAAGLFANDKKEWRRQAMLVPTYSILRDTTYQRTT